MKDNTWRDLPRLSAYPNKDNDLYRSVDDDLANDTSQDLARNKASCWTFVVDFGVWQSPTHYHKGCQQSNLEKREMESKEGYYSLATAIGMITKRSIYKNLCKSSVPEMPGYRRNSLEVPQTRGKRV